MNRPERTLPVEAIIYHYTAGSTAEGAISHLTNPTSQVSAHFVVDRDGVCYQLASLEDRTWHAGSATSALFDGKFKGWQVNARTIGIEVVNLGPLLKKPDGGFYPVATPNKLYRGEIAVAPFRGFQFWQPYTVEQIEAVKDLTTTITREYPILLQDPERRLIGHYHVDPSRKTDPGPTFNFKAIRAIRPDEEGVQPCTDCSRH